jgi:hypothetical protein
MLTDFGNSNVAAHGVSFFGLFLYQSVSLCIKMYLYVTSSRHYLKNLLLTTNIDWSATN